MGSVVGSMNNVKIFILYLMQNVGYPLDFVSINDIVMQTDYVMYLDFAVAFNAALGRAHYTRDSLKKRGFTRSGMTNYACYFP